LQLIGLIPAAGTARRLGTIPCSKEIFPVLWDPLPNQAGRRPKGCCQDLLEKMQLAGARCAYIVVREGKWDIPAYLGDGSGLGISLAYLMMNAPFGVPFTLDQAYPFVKDALILFGFPDILFLPRDAYIQMLQRLDETRADMVLGLFKSAEPETCDMVNLTAEGHIAGIEIKSAVSRAQWSWIIAVWRPAFTEYMHGVINNKTAKIDSWLADPETPGSVEELYLGQVIGDALEAGVNIKPYLFNNGRYLDIGTLKNLSKASAF
jgi:glucose-1-phosphate thymidylyltransferase